MQLVINLDVDDDTFTGMIDQELKNIPKETMQEIITTSVKEYLLKDDNVSKLLYKEKEDRWSFKEIVPSYFSEKMIRNLDYSALQEVVDKAIDELKDNYQQILLKVLTEALVNGLTTSSYSFTEQIHYAVSDIINNNRQG